MSEAVTSPTLPVPSRTQRLKKPLLIGGATLTVLLAAILIVPHFIDLGIFKNTYLPLVEDALGRRVDVGEVHLRLVPTPSINLSKLKVSDAAAFAGNTFFAAQQVQLRLKFWPLLRGRFEVTELVLDKPVINLLKQADGSFNYSDITGRKSAPGMRREPRRPSNGAGAARTAERSAPPPLVLPSRVRIRDGQLNLETRGQTPVHVRGIELALQELGANKPFPFRVSFQYPGLNLVALEGQIDYDDDKAQLELRDNKLRIQDLTLPVRGTVQNLGTAPRLNLNLSATQVDAKPVFQILSVFGLAPRDTEISGPMELRMNVAGPSNALVTQIEGVFKNVFVNGKRALKGSLNGQVELRLPLGGGAVARRLVGNGKLVASDGELTNQNMIKKMHRAMGMAGLTEKERREATTFKSLEADFTVAGGAAEFTRLYMINPQMEVTGSGTMTIDQPTLNIELSTTMLSQSWARGTGRGRTAALFKDAQGRTSVPLKITGPVENPSVNVNTDKLAETGLAQKIEKGFGSFFKNLFRNR